MGVTTIGNDKVIKLGIKPIRYQVAAYQMFFRKRFSLNKTPFVALKCQADFRIQTTHIKQQIN